MNNPADTLAALARIRNNIESMRKGLPDEWQDWVAEQVRDLNAALASLKGEAAKPKFTTGHCENHRKPGGCHLHNLQCGYPECDRRPIEPTTPPAPQAAEIQLLSWWCPRCGGVEVSRERRPNGNATCENGHTYPMRETIRAHNRPTLATQPQQAATPSPAPAPQGGGEWFAMESLPVNAPKQHPERNAAEQAYTQTAFNYEANPIGCRDWTIYWRGWWHRAVINDLTTPPAQQPGEVVTDEMVEAAEKERVRSLNAITAYGSAGVEERHLMAMRRALTAALAPKEKG